MHSVLRNKRDNCLALARCCYCLLSWLQLQLFCLQDTFNNSRKLRAASAAAHAAGTTLERLQGPEQLPAYPRVYGRARRRRGPATAPADRLRRSYRMRVQQDA